MVTYVGSSSRSQATVSWPAGTAAGDVAVLLLLTPRVYNGRSALVAPDGWDLAAMEEWQGTWWPAAFAPKESTWEAAGLAWKRVRSADLAAPITLPTDAVAGSAYYGAVVVYRDSRGVGAVSGADAVVGLYDTGASSGSPPSGVSAVGSQFPVRPRHIPYSNGQHSYTWYGMGRALTSSGLSYTRVGILGPLPPDPPEWVEPADRSDVSHTDDLALRLSHRPTVPGGLADAYQVQVAVVAGGGDGSGTPAWDRWLTAAGTLSATEQTLTITPALAVTDVLPDALLTDGDRVVLRARTREVTDQKWSGWGPELTVFPVEAPTVTVTGPTGTVTDDWTPTITFTVAGGAHASVQARIVGPGSTGVDDGVLWDSGAVSMSGLEITADVAQWVQDGAHRPWVRVRTVGGAWSAWASGSLFTMSWTPPAAPTVTASWTAGADGIEVTVAGASVGDEVDLQRLDPVVGWVDVSRIVVEEAGDVVVTDVQAPYDVDVTYRARLRGSLDGAFIPGEWGTSGPARSMQDCSLLVDAEAPLSRWLRVRWSADSTHVHDQVMTVTRGIGDPRPRVAVGTYQGRTGTWVFRANTVADRATLLGFIHSCRVMTLVTPPEREPGGGRRAVPHLTVRRAAPLAVGRLAQSSVSYRDVTMDWVEADPVEPRDTTTGIAGGVLLVTDVTTGPGGTILVETP